jgi:hypothetical protein
MCRICAWHGIPNDSIPPLPGQNLTSDNHQANLRVEMQKVIRI